MKLYVTDAMRRVLIGLALGSLLVLVLSAISPGAPLDQALPGGLSLGLMVAALAAVGEAVATLAGWASLRANPALCVALGQFFLLGWMVVRSLLSAVSMGLWQVPLPCTGREVLVVGVAFVLLGSRRVRGPSSDAGAWLPSLAVMMCAAVAIGLREFPRLISLSSDPDQHAFWAQQLIEFGRIPWDLGPWGPLDFQYPAGFALLARLWTVPPLNVVESVMAQPLLQAVLAVGALSIWASQRVTGSCRPVQVPTLLLAFVVFFALMPFALTKYFLHLEKTGSLSTLLLTVLMAALLCEFWRAEPRQRRRAAATLGALLGYTALINPVAVVLPGLLCAMIVAAWSLRHRRLPYLLLLLALLPFALVLMADPYYFKRFLLHVAPPPPEAVVGLVAVPPSVAAALLYLKTYLVTAEWLRPWLLIPYFGHPWVSPLLVLIALGTLVGTKQLNRTSWIIVGGLPLACTVIGLLLMPVFDVLKDIRDLYLLEPYLKDSIARFAYLWLFGLILFAMAAALSRMRLGGKGWRAVVLCIPLLAWPLGAVRAQLPTEIHLDSRTANCGQTPCSFTDDLQLLALIRLQHLIPETGDVRVLVPNEVAQVWRERWLFPVGFARALPIHWTQPLAFFYGKGHPDFSYRNYVEHVCQRLDADWLRARGVGYVFVPSDHRSACLNGLPALMVGPNVVLRVGNAALIRLPGTNDQ
jgi:hypothetical protein